MLTHAAAFFFENRGRKNADNPLMNRCFSGTYEQFYFTSSAGGCQYELPARNTQIYFTSSVTKPALWKLNTPKSTSLTPVRSSPTP